MTPPPPRIDERVAAAKLYLVSPPAAGQDSAGPKNLPYLSTALYALATVPTSEVDAMACDEHWRLYINPDWAAAADILTLAAQLAHHTWHLLADHAGRAHSMGVGPATSTAWSQAADAALAATLGADGLRPETLPTPADLHLPQRQSAEEYYAQLSRLPATRPDNAADNTTGGPAGDGTGGPVWGPCGSGCDGIPRISDLPGDVDTAAAVTSIEAGLIRRTVAIDYLDHATTRGTEPGDAWRWASDILEPVVDWRPLLASTVRRAAATTYGHTDYTYRRRSRRQAASPRVILPGTQHPLPAVAVIVDTSASVDDILLGQALGEIDGILAGLGIEQGGIHLLACDAAVHVVSTIQSARKARLAGGGGTDLRAGITTATRLRPKPEIIIVLTDGNTPWPHTPPPAVTIAALLGYRRQRQRLPATPHWAIRIECLT